MHIILEDLKACDVDHPSWKKVIVYFFTHPEFKAVLYYRWSSILYGKGGLYKFIGKFFWLRVVKNTGCYLSPKAKIGKGLRLPHATGIVIGDGVIIGEHATIYQHVTLGQKSDLYPAIGHHTTIYPGACIVGGIKIGDHVQVGANSVVFKDVKDHTVVAGVPAKVLSTVV